MGFWSLPAGLWGGAPYAWSWPWLGFACGALLVAGALRAPRVSGLALLLLSALAAVLFLAAHADGARPGWQAALFAAEFAAAALAAAFGHRRLAGRLERLRERWTRRGALGRDARTDIRTVAALLPAARARYDPRPHLDDPDSLFAGLDERGRPVRIARELWRRSHVDIVGMTGSGKGVLAGVLLSQAARQGEAVFAVDPKRDRYAPLVLAQAARDAGVEYLELDLAAGWNPLAGKTADELEELFVSGFGLEERGSDADFYRLQDRRAARECARMAAEQGLAPAALLAEFRTLRAAREAKLFLAALEELAGAEAPAAAPAAAPDLAAALEAGAVVYAKGALRHPRVCRLQRMFVLSAIQHCERRGPGRGRHACLFLDEFRYLVSAPVLEALASLRDRRAHLVLAHQTLHDLRRTTAELDPEQAAGSVAENCGLKFAYRVHDPDTAQWLARMSGSIRADDELRELETDRLLTERGRGARALRQTERHLVDANMLQSLPPRCAVLYGDGLAKFAFTSPVPVAEPADGE